MEVETKMLSLRLITGLLIEVAVQQVAAEQGFDCIKIVEEIQITEVL